MGEEQKQSLVLPSAREGLQPVFCHFNGGERSGGADLEELSRRITESLFAVSLPSDMLRKVDMMSMLSSIEVRVPMLDEQLVTLGLSLPHPLKTDGRTGKLVLRSIAGRWLPRTVAAHPKHGFAIPVDVMVRQDFHQMLEDVLLASSARVRAFLNVELIDRWLRLFKQAQQDCWVGSMSREGLYQRIFILLSLELWLRAHKLSW
jgi:asparagine synthetase B (glutamine-hydrolysing)